jgi:hypothetical protein
VGSLLGRLETLGEGLRLDAGDGSESVGRRLDGGGDSESVGRRLDAGGGSESAEYEPALETGLLPPEAICGGAFE